MGCFSTVFNDEYFFKLSDLKTQYNSSGNKFAITEQFLNESISIANEINKHFFENSINNTADEILDLHREFRLDINRNKSMEIVKTLNSIFDIILNKSGEDGYKIITIIAHFNSYKIFLDDV